MVSFDPKLAKQVRGSDPSAVVADRKGCCIGKTRSQKMRTTVHSPKAEGEHCKRIDARPNQISVSSILSGLFALQSPIPVPREKRVPPCQVHHCSFILDATDDIIIQVQRMRNATSSKEDDKKRAWLGKRIDENTAELGRGRSRPRERGGSQLLIQERRDQDIR